MEMCDLFMYKFIAEKSIQSIFLPIVAYSFFFFPFCISFILPNTNYAN